jgi:hypothetical protein
MTTTAIDSQEWLEAIDQDPELTADDLLAGHYYAGAETNRTDEQLQASFDKLADRGYFTPILVLDEQASFDIRKALPKGEPMTWRDLSEQLKPDQITNLEKTEALLTDQFPDDDPTAGMLDLAGTLVESNKREAAGIETPQLTENEAQALWDRLGR